MYIGVLQLKVFWNKATGNPYIDMALPITNDCRLADIVRREVLHKNSSHDTIDFVRDIKSATTASGTDASRLFELPVSTFFDIIKNDETKQLTVVINKPTPVSSIEPTVKVHAIFTKPKVVYKNFESKYDVDQVKLFQQGYKDANNKQTYLSTTKDKPSVKEQIRTSIVSDLVENKIQFRGGTGGEEDRAEDGLKQLVNIVHFVHERRSILSRSQKSKYQSSGILVSVEDAIAAKACKSKLGGLTKDGLREWMDKADKCIRAFPTSFRKVQTNGDRYAEALLVQIEIMIDIMGTRLDEMYADDDRKKQNNSKTTGMLPSSTNAHSYVIKAKTVPPPVKSTYVKNLKQQMEESDPYTLFHLTDKMMGINKDIIQDRNLRSKERAKFLTYMQFDFPVGVFIFKRYGTYSNWVVVCRMEKGDTESGSKFRGFVTDATAQAPVLLSNRQTQDAIATISMACGKDRRFSKALLMAMMPDGTLPSFNGDDANEKQFVEDTMKCILQADGDDEMEMITDMRHFNCRGNNDKSLYQEFWTAASRVLEMENGSGAHNRRHAAADVETTIEVSYAPGIVSVPQLRRATIKLLEDEGKKIDIDFKAPCLSWLYLQLSPNNEYKETAERYTGVLPYKLSLQSRDLRANHPHAHWVAAMKRCWRWDASGLWSLLEAHDEDDDDMKAPCLKPTQAMSYNGCDDKAGVPVGRTIPISASARQSNRVLMEPGQKPQASDHDFLSERGTVSGIHRMNISNNPGDSLYSGGPDGHGRGYVSTHNATLDPSSGLKHIAHFYQYMLHVAREQSPVEDIERLRKELPYVVLIETDGGPDHNLTFLKNILSLFGLFLVGNMDKLTATRCCSGLSFMNVAERLMSLLTLGMSGLSLMMDPNADSFLMEDVIGNISSMKGVRDSIAEYDDAVKKVLDILERRLKRVADAAAPASGNDEAVIYMESQQDKDDSGTTITAKVGDDTMRFFEGHGKFKGRVEAINPDAPHDKCIRVRYEDEDVEDLTQDELDSYSAEASIAIGDVGFCFIKKFGRSGYFSGKVIEIQDNGKRMCSFCDGERYSYTLAQLEVYARIKKTADDNNASDDDDDDASFEEDEEDDDEAMVDTGNSDETLAEAVVVDSVVDATVPKASKKKSKNESSRKFVEKLLTIPVGTSLQSHYEKLKEQPSAFDSFNSAMRHPMQILEERYSKLQLDGRSVQVLPYATSEDCKIITDRLTRFDPAYSSEYTSKSQLKKMPLIAEFFSSQTHCRFTDYTVEFKLCGVSGCSLCAKVGRSVRTPDIEVNGINLREEALRFMTLPVVNVDDEEHYLPPAKAREYTENNDLSLDDLLRFIPDAKKNDTETKKAVAAGKKKDKTHTFHSSKVRAVGSCLSCAAKRCIFSDKMVGSKDGPTKKEQENLESLLEREGYTCGSEIKGGKFFARQSLVCGSPIESDYYNPQTGTKGGRIVTKDICALCYVSDDLVSPNEIMKTRDIGGKVPLTICRGCYDSGVEPPCSAGRRKNVKQAKQQKKATKKRKHAEVANVGRRKVRKNPRYDGDVL